MKRRKTWNRGIETNILQTYNAASPEELDAGMNWYANANLLTDGIAKRTGVPLWAVCGVIAALSPGSLWGRNVLEAEELISAWKANLPLPLVGVYGKRNVDKAIQILKGTNPLDVLPESGPKTRSFFANILFPQTSDAVTVDRHAKALAYGLHSIRLGYASNSLLSTVRVGEYDYLAWHYRRVAERLGLIPSQLQAICWIVWKRLGQEQAQDEVPF